MSAKEESFCRESSVEETLASEFDDPPQKS